MGTTVVGRSANCEDVLKRYHIDHCSLAIIGADRLAEFPDWRVMVAGSEGHNEYLDVGVAANLASDLRRVGEIFLAERLDHAVQLARRQMEPKSQSFSPNVTK